MLCALLGVWWIIEFLIFAGRVDMDPLDVAGIAIFAAGGWACPPSMEGALSRVWQSFFRQFCDAALVSSFFRVPILQTKLSRTRLIETSYG